MTILQPRSAVGQFGSTGESPHEKHRWHSHQAHICRVNAAIARYNAETSQAETHDVAASAHQRLAETHLAAALSKS